MASEYAYVGKGVTNYALVTQVDAGAPAAGDFLIHAEGNQTINTNPTQFTALVNGFQRIEFKRPFTGKVATAGTSFGVDCNYSATACFYYDAGGGELFYAPPATCLRFKNIGFGKLWATGGSFTNFEQTHGARSNFNSSAVCVNARVFGSSIDADYNATAFTLLEVYNATANIQRSITTLEVGGNSTVNVYNVDASATQATAVDVNVRGGTLTWKGGNITSLNLRGGPIDLTNVAGSPTITNITGTRELINASKWNPARVTITGTIFTVYGGWNDSLSPS